ncbi:DNA polymerase III subunit chi, partial [Psychrobacter sp.]
MKISFYVLSENKAQEILGFICQLTQTALNKSTQSLLILIEDEALLSSLDEALWAQDSTSFIPHQRLV